MPIKDLKSSVKMSVVFVCTKGFNMAQYSIQKKDMD
jgi:hypothetical protein